jgi:DNA processing protein
MKLKVINKQILNIYEDKDKQKLLRASDFQKIMELKTRFSDYIRRKGINLIEGKDYYKVNIKECSNKKQFKNKFEYYITQETAQRICFICKSKTCQKIQEYALKHKEKEFLDILITELNKTKQEERLEEIRKITIYDKEYPDKLKQIKNPPKKIYIKGNAELLKENGIAVVGSRTTSNYGRKMCKIFVNNLVGYHLNIISGLAIGIDSLAHKTCIEAQGKTIAVLPCGLKHIYPKNNEILYNKILEEGGLIVSEYELDEKENSDHFRERNRIVSGLSIGTLVVESHRRSGTSITVRNTEEQNKKSFCIPSSLENTRGTGNNEMIRDRRAKLVTTVEDIIEEYTELNLKKKEEYEFLEINSPKKNTKMIIENKNISKDIVKDISEENIEIYNAIMEGAETIDEIVRKTNKGSKEVSYKLTMLELENTIETLPGKRFKIKR